MTTGQENKIRMYLTCDTFLLSRWDILKVLPNFEIIYKTLHSQLDEIQNLSEQPSFDIVGIAVSRKQLKHDLAVMADDIARKLHVFAHITNDYPLLYETWLPQSELLASSDSKLTERAKGIYDRAASYLRELTLYGITADTQSAFSKAISNFEASLPLRPVRISDAKMKAKQIAACFKSADVALHQIDSLINIFRFSVPDLYNAYKQSRKTVDYTSQPVALKGLVTDANTNAPVKGVSVLFVRCDKSFHQPPFVEYSADHGDFYVQSLAEGTYEVKLNKIGYKELIITSKVNKGEPCEINTKMNRV
jgi:hypothetical protein